MVVCKETNKDKAKILVGNLIEDAWWNKYK